MKNFIYKTGIVLLLASLGLAACSTPADPVDPVGPEPQPEPRPTTGIIGKGVALTRTGDEEVRIAFTDDQIAWFDPATREIGFRGIEPEKWPEMYREIRFELDGETLFTALTIKPIASTVVRDLVLMIEYADGWHYYLHDGYPLWAAESDEAKAAAAARAEGWQRFEEQLAAEGKLRDAEHPWVGRTYHIWDICREYNDTGDYPMECFIPDDDYRWSGLEGNALYVIRNEDQLRKLVSTETYTPSGIDFTKNSLLLVWINTPNGICQLDAGLRDRANGYEFSMRVLLSYTTDVGSRLCALLAPVIGQEQPVAFNLEITHTGISSDDTYFTPDYCREFNDTGDIPMSCFVPEGEWKWKKLSYNKLQVIHNEMQLRELVAPEDYTPTGIDFTKHSLLLVWVCTPNGIRLIEAGLGSGASGYTLSMQVRMYATCDIGSRICAFVVPEISEAEDVSFKIDLTHS